VTSPRWRWLCRQVLARILFYGGLLFIAWWWMLRMPGQSYAGALAPLTALESATEAQLAATVGHLADGIGERNVLLHPQALSAAADFIESAFQSAGLAPQSQSFAADGAVCRNVEAEIRGGSMPGEIVVIGAHYDSIVDSPGADDNASGVAAMLALAAVFARAPQARTLRFVAFANEEPPYFGEKMGSAVYAKSCKARGERIAAMLSFDSVGFYSDADHSQRYPLGLGLFNPSRGNFVAFVGNVQSAGLVREAVGAFRSAAALPSIGAGLPGVIPGVAWSDQYAFWEEGYRAIEITDTAPYRNPAYHTRKDTGVDFHRLTKFVTGMQRVVEKLAGEADARH
jgi:hypothetical protein